MLNFIDLLPNIKDELILAKQNEVTSKMRRKPLHPPAVPNTPEGDKIGYKRVVNVDLAEDGSIRTYLEGQPHPVRFYPSMVEMEIIASFKRIFMYLANNGFWGLLALWMNRKVWAHWIEFLIEKYRIALNDENWSQVVKEIRRVLKGRIEDSFLDAISVILEYDSAYRYRVQDIAGELKEGFRYKELTRLLDIFISRETDTRNIPIVKKIRKFAWVLWILYGKQIKEAVKDLNIDELRMSKEDEWHTDQYRINNCGFYKFRGL